MKRGFTLIELLVAVLIIGVLTAVAIPMYQKSVDKSRYATLMPLAKNIKDAQEAFYLGGGKYSKDLGSLDVRVPGNPSGNTATLSDGTTVEISNTDSTGYVKMGKENLNNYYVMYQDRSSSYPGEIHCEALTDSDRANELCQNLGGTKIDNSLTSGYTAYVLVGTGENAGSGGTSGGTSSGEKTLVSRSTDCKDQGSDYTCLGHLVYDDGSYTDVYKYRGLYTNVFEYGADGEDLDMFFAYNEDNSLSALQKVGFYYGSDGRTVTDYSNPDFDAISYNISDGSFAGAVRKNGNKQEEINEEGLVTRERIEYEDGGHGVYVYGDCGGSVCLSSYSYSNSTYTDGANWGFDSDGQITWTTENVSEYADKLAAIPQEDYAARWYDVSSFPAAPADMDLRPFCERFPDYC